MADDTKDRRSDGQPADPISTAQSTTGGKRPYATLDLKATEIKITAVPENTQSYAINAARGYSVSKSDSLPNAETPGPAPASTYATTGTSKPEPVAKTENVPKATETKSSASASTANAPPDATTPSTSAPQSISSTSSNAPKSETVVITKRGGFFSHMAAGIFGGALALTGSQWGLQQLGIETPGLPVSQSQASLEQRLKALETQTATADSTKSIASLEERLASVEKSTDTIAALKESQSRLVAETKAALASSASDAGVPEQLERVAKLEDQIKSLVDAGANDPNAGRLAQLATLTGKVSDLETSLTTQLTALRKSVADDVEARIASVTESSAAAKSGTQRIDKDIAGVKSDAALQTEQLQSLKTDNDRLNATLKMAQDETTALKTSLEELRAVTAKPSDVSSAIKPVGDKLAGLEVNVASLVKAEEARRSTAERVLLSLELQNLKRALDGGQKYASELAAVQKASSGKFDVATLDKFKDSGVPPLPDLARDFRSTANSAIDADTDPVEGGVVDRLIAGAKAVVRVRKVDHAADDKSAEAVVGRMETALKEARLPDVLSEAKALSPKAQAAAQLFLDKVAARVSVDTAVGAIEQQLKTSLNSDPAIAPAPTP